MEDTGEVASSSKLDSVNVKPVIVRVKRKALQSPVEALWLEINERPLKRPLLDFAKLSISGSTEKEELKTKKILVEHVETVSSSDATIDLLQSFVDPNSTDASDLKRKIDERKLIFKEGNKQNQLLLRSRQKHEFMAKNARFEQIWKKRKGNKETMDDGSLHEICDLYDVVRVDDEEKSNKGVEPEDVSLEDNMILCNYLPLVREFLPNVAEEIESNMQSHHSQQESEDEYVYDLYAVQNEFNSADADALNSYPLVQVDYEDFYDGPEHSDYETDDSNAEDNPLNDYPDEETSEDGEDEDEVDEDEDDGDSVDDMSLTSGDHSNELTDESYQHEFEDGDSLYGEEDGEDDQIYEFR